MTAIAAGCLEQEWGFLVIGDTKSPADFNLRGARFMSVESQLKTGFQYAGLAPVRHYARKNIGYLVAMREGAQTIVETDDDNFPSPPFWHPGSTDQRAHVVSQPGWTNVYRYFTDVPIWPRGYPLDLVHAAVPPRADLPVRYVHCPVQQGLVNENPDVDAIYRLVLPLPQNFRREPAVALTGGAWCPFNSQNTVWHRDAFPLLYLPAHCSFRMTDIWRSFVVQRILAANGLGLLFTSASAVQERNEHNLMSDFAAEVPGYNHNRALMACLEKLPLTADPRQIGENLLACYRALVQLGLFPEDELPLVRAWLSDLEGLAP